MRLVGIALLLTALLTIPAGRPPLPARSEAETSSRNKVRATADASPMVSFVDVAGEVGVTLQNFSGAVSKTTINEAVGSGVCIYDVDDDGFLDIFLPNGLPESGRKPAAEPRSALYRNRGDGTFEDVTHKAGVGSPGYWAQGCVFGDYDDDGNVDLFVTGFGRYILYRNLGKGRFQDVTTDAGFDGSGWSTGAAFGDYDGDGRIDLYVSHYLDYGPGSPPLPTPGDGINCMYRGHPVICGPRGLKHAVGRLYRNEGNGRFRDVTRTSGIRTEPGGYGLGAIWTDLDLDGDLDLYVANDSTPNYLYRNEGGRFTEIGTVAGVAYSEDGREQAGMGVDAADFDNDGRLDLLVTNFSHDYSTLYHNEDGHFFLDVSLMSGLGPPTMPMLGWGAGFLDYDNDGLKDIFLANGHVYPGIDQFNLGTTFKQTNQLFRNVGGGRFRDTTGQAGPAFRVLHSARGAAFGDLDNDGDIDIVVNNIDEPPSVLRNDGGNAASWIGLHLRGVRRNRGAIGARVRVIAGALRQMAEIHAGSSHNSSSDPRLHFGLGSATRADTVEIRWPDGWSQTLTGLAAGRYHTITEPERPAR